MDTMQKISITDYENEKNDYEHEKKIVLESIRKITFDWWAWEGEKKQVI